jgi:uncharacterized protein
MLDALKAVLQREPRIAYALLFGSHARGAAHARSDVDVAIGGLTSPLSPLELGDLTARLEGAAGRDVDLVVLDDAPPGLAYRVFRDGVTLLERDPRALAERKARACLDWFDWKPIEDVYVAALRSAPRG